MEFTIYEQTYSFFAAALLGFFIGVIYDFFRCIKKQAVSSGIMANIADLSFIPVAFLFYFYALYKFNGFSIRFYHILGTLIGLILYFNTVNNLIFRFFSLFLKIFQKIFKILLYPVKFLCKIVCRILLSIKNIFIWILNIISNFFKKRINSLKKIFKRRKKI